MKAFTAKAEFVIALAFLFSISSLPILSSPVYAKTFKVDCSKGNQALQKAIDKKLKDGDEIEVSGNCVENIVVAHDHIRIRGGGTATITAADPSAPVIELRGSNLGVTDFASISGGTHGISLIRSAGAIIARNTIENNSGNGVLVTQNSAGRMTENVIQTNNRGVLVQQGGQADILSNDILSNNNDGVLVQEGAVAEIDDNDINDNGLDGILVRRTSHVTLSESSGLGVANRLNRNGGFGLRCNQNSSLRDNVGQAFGAGGDANVSGDFDVSVGCSTSGAGLP